MPVDIIRLQALIDERLRLAHLGIKKGLPRKIELKVQEDGSVEIYAFGMFYQNVTFTEPALNSATIDTWLTQITQRIRNEIASAILKPGSNNDGNKPVSKRSH